MKLPSLIKPCLAAILGTLPMWSAAASWQVQDLGSLGGTAASPLKTVAYGLNDAGQVVGSSYIDATHYHAFMTGANGLGITDLMSTTPRLNGVALDINNSAQVVGITHNTNDIGFVTGANGQNLQSLQWYDPLLHKNIVVLGDAVAINDAGQVTGRFVNPHTSQTHAYVTTVANTGLTDLGQLVITGSAGVDINASGQIVAKDGKSLISTPDGLALTAMAPSSNLLEHNSNTPYAINDAGDVVGSFGVNPLVGFVYRIGSNAAPRLIGSLGGTGVNAATVAYDINNHGVVVGYSFNAAMKQHAFVNGLPGQAGSVDLNDLFTLSGGAYFTDARAINDANQIIANASNGHAYILSSVPEPSSALMVVSALAGMCLNRKARSRRA